MKLVQQKHGGAVNQFEPGESGNENGRPKKLLSSLLADIREAGFESVKPVNIVEAYEALLGLDEKQLQEITLDKARPMIARIVAKAMLSPRGAEMLETMLDRVHGKAVQKFTGEVKQELHLSGEKRNMLETLLGIRNK